MRESSSSASKVSSAGSVEGEVGATKTEICVPRNIIAQCVYAAKLGLICTL